MPIAQELPLFPLHTVLFPGGVLPLRVFETRYLDMISACLRAGSGFVVIGLQEGHETGAAPARLYPVGTRARIVDFDQLQDGLLGITCQGETRLQLLDSRIQPDQLRVGTVEALPDDPRQPPLPMHQPLVRILRDLLARSELAPYSRFLSPDWECAAWIGNRLGELLPLSLPVRQALLEMTEPQQRLDMLLTLFQEQHNA